MLALGASAVLLWWNGFDSTVTMPFLKHVRPDLGLLYVPLASIVIVGASNAVNLTDGLDGLAIVPGDDGRRSSTGSSATSPAT